MTLPSITSQGRTQWIIKQYSHIEAHYASPSNPKQPKKNTSNVVGAPRPPPHPIAWSSQMKSCIPLWSPSLQSTSSNPCPPLFTRYPLLVHVSCIIQATLTLANNEPVRLCLWCGLPIDDSFPLLAQVRDGWMGDRRAVLRSVFFSAELRSIFALLILIPGDCSYIYNVRV
jgi:hypothetical protein